MLVQHLSHLVYVINWIDDLVSFLFRFVLLSDLVFELIVELSVDLLNLFDLSLNFLHFFRFCVHFLGHLLDLTLFLLANCFHLLSNGNFALPKIPILLFQVDESVAELIDKKFFLVLGWFVLLIWCNNLSQLGIRHYKLQKLTELFMGFKLSLALLKFNLLNFNWRLELFDGMLMLLDLLLVIHQLLILLLPPQLICDHNSDVLLNILCHLLLLLREWLRFFI